MVEYSKLERDVSVDMVDNGLVTGVTLRPATPEVEFDVQARQVELLLL